MAATRDVALVVPVLMPGAALVRFLEGVRPYWEGPIVVVDDGAGAASTAIGEELTRAGCVVLHHAVRQGKGRTLKTAFNECALRWPNLLGVVMTDGDGRYEPEDVLRVAARLAQRPDALVLGVRDVNEKGRPLVEDFGNKATRQFMRYACRLRVNDAQTGLRGLPMSFVRRALELEGERYEFETAILLETRQAQVPIVEVPIAFSFSHLPNKSEYHVISDSLRIFLRILVFALSSMTATLVDFGLYTVFIALFAATHLGVAGIGLATVLARVVSATLNFAINRKVVFHSQGGARKDAVRFFALAACIMMASALGVMGVCALTGLPSIPVKVCVDLGLFFVNYNVQRVWVFQTGAAEGEGREAEAAETLASAEAELEPA